MSKFIIPLGTCEATNKKQYKSQYDCQQVCDWANKQNAKLGNPIRVQPEECSECGYWHVVPVKQNTKSSEPVSEVDNFFEGSSMTLEEMVDELTRAGYWVIEPKNVERAARRLKWVKKLLEDEKENA